jgi:hypothetical protein
LNQQLYVTGNPGGAANGALQGVKRMRPT